MCAHEIISSMCKFRKYLLNVHHVLILMLRIGCPEVDGKPLSLLRSHQHVSGIPEPRAESREGAIDAHGNGERTCRRMACEVHLEERMGSLYGRTQDMLSIQHDVLFEGKGREVEVKVYNEAGPGKVWSDIKDPECHKKLGLDPLGNEGGYLRIVGYTVGWKNMQ